MATEVATAADLNMTVRNNPGGSYIQTANIDMSGYNWNPIENFTGTYDGGGYAINNFYMARPANDSWWYYALFKDLTGATVKNVRMIDIDIQIPFDGDTLLGGTGIAAVGAVATNTTFENCFVTGVINGGYNGGICVEAAGCSFWKCATKIDFTGYAYFFGNYEGSFYDLESTHEGAGIVNYAEDTTIKDCYSRMTFDGGNTFVNEFNDVDLYLAGGMTVYLIDSSVENCYTTGIDTISDPYYTTGSTITNSYYPGSSGGNGTPRSVDAMTYPENFTTTYIDWDFDTVWVSDTAYTINDGYPHFGVGFNIWVKKSGEWLQVTDIWVKKGGVWQAVTDVSTLKGGSWNPV